MTVEEAVVILKNAIKKPNTEDGYLGQALTMAIEALEQQPITWIVGKDDCQVAVRNMPIDKMQKICAIKGEEEQQPCEDYISRQAVIRLVEQYPNIIGNRCSGLIADIKHLPSVTPKLQEWLSSFNTDSATECFVAVQELRKKIKSN